MKRIKQIEESRDMLSKALLKIMERDEFSKISISQITAEAGVSRNTFYRNFKSKEDILNYSLKKVYKAVVKKLENHKPATIEDFLIWRFKLFKNSPMIETLRKSNLDIYPVIRQFRAENLLPIGGDETRQGLYRRVFYTAGIDYITAVWLEEGAQESPEEMAALVVKLINLTE